MMDCLTGMNTLCEAMWTKSPLGVTVVVLGVTSSIDKVLAHDMQRSCIYRYVMILALGMACHQ